MHALLLIADGPVFRLGTALAIGLLIGAERERRKSESPARSAAGIRTFAVAGLLGGVSVTMGGYGLLAVSTLATAGLCVAAYLRSHDEDPGITSETALVLTVLLGGLAQREVAIASGVAVVVTILLAARTRLHHFVRHVLSEQELTDALIFAAAVLVVLPLTPNQYLGPFDAINPRTIWMIVILMISISAGGYIALRLLGPRFGLPLAGFASGFVSSAATIGAMATRAKREPALMRSAVAGAMVSNVATVVQMAIVLAVISEPTFKELLVPLVAAGVAVTAYGTVLTFMSIRHQVPDMKDPGRAFDLKTALGLACTITAIVLASAACNAWFGERGLVVAAAIAGFADTHSAAVSVASLVTANKIAVHDAAIPILLGLTSNTVTKAIIATWLGGLRFAVQVIPGLALMMLAAWIGLGFVFSH